MKITHRVLATMVEKGRVFEPKVACLTGSELTALLVHVAIHGEGWTMTQGTHGFVFLNNNKL